MIARKLTNISDVDVVVDLEDGNSVNVPSGGVLEDVNVKNLNNINKFVKVEQDLSEVPVSEARTYLKG